MKFLVSIGLGIAAALVGLDLTRAPLWGLPRALEPDGGAGSGSAGRLGRFRKSGRFRRTGDLPWDEVCSDLAFQVRAGNTLVQAISSISQEGTSSAHKKLRKAYQLYETGVPITKALEMAADGDGELYMIAAILEIGAISGGDTASLLWRLFEILRRRRMFRGEVNARLSEARLTSRLLLALPWIIGFFTFRHDPELIRGFVASLQGRPLVIAGLLLWAVGGVLIRIALGSVYPSTAYARPRPEPERGGKAP
ncbi:MAG: type II secretion system F family protein [Bacillota bacterium]